MSELIYNKRIDELEVYSSRGEYKTSVRDDDYIFHISHDGKVIGMEILNASENLQLEPEVLSNIKEAKIKSRIQTGGKRNLLEVGIFLLGKDINYQRDLRIRNLHNNPIKA
ncbi:MAG: DUF2283 domain-containing protein [Candidatus Aenigmatarchaeota archaeon]